jgi:ankyrin repeat protein
MGPDVSGGNTLNAPNALVPIAAWDAIEYVPDPFVASYNSIFIPNCKKDMERQLATLSRNIMREEILTENIPTDDLILFGEASDQTHVDKMVMKQYKEDQTATKDMVAAAIDKALWAAKGGNISALEDALEEHIPIDTTDQFGNSLLILAAQQGSKRMIKFLLRRGANMNWQNTTGNTALHYCYAYNNPAIGEYLKRRVRGHLG